jgi:AcrR family transcriptional regulator
VAGTNPETLTRILEASRRLITRHGTTLSMSEVAAEAAVSRATVYRYFRSRDDLVVATEDHIHHRFEVGLAEVVNRAQSASERLTAIIDYCVQSNDSNETRHLCELHPRLAVKYLRLAAENDVNVLHRGLRPVYDEMTNVRSGRLDPKSITRIMLGMLHANMLIHRAPADALRSDLVALFDRFQDEPALAR